MTKEPIPTRSEKEPSAEAIHAAEGLLSRLRGYGPAIVYQGDTCQWAGQANLIARFAQHFQDSIDAGRAAERERTCEWARGKNEDGAAARAAIGKKGPE